MTSDPILSAFARRLARAPRAVVLLSRGGTIDVSGLDRLARSLADELARAGVGPGTLVGLAAANGPGFVAGLLAIRHTAAAALLFDPRTPRGEKTRTERALGAAFDLTAGSSWPEAAADFRLEGLDPERVAELRDDVAAVKLTSGSTGCPRGIVTPSAALVADEAALTRTMGLRDDERILAALPMSHSYALSSVVMPALVRDAVLVVPEAGHPLDPVRIARREKVSFLPTVPAYLQALVKMSRPPRIPDSLRLVISAGAPLKPATARRFREIYGLPVHVFYGSSECGGITFDRTGAAGERGSLGTPVDGVRVSLEPPSRDSVTLADAPEVVTVRSPAVARSYLPEADPALGGGRFETCDLGAWQDGELILRGRLGNVINVRGKKVDPLEVDAVLQQLEAVEESVTLGVQLPGKGETVVRSFVASRSSSLCPETVQRWCRQHLASHKVPRSIVLLERLPRTERGKLDRAALLAHARTPCLPAVGEGEADG